MTILTDPLSDEEHETRAMLLGWIYIPKHGYYRDDRGAALRSPRYDVITLEEVPTEEVTERQNSYKVTQRERYYARTVCLSYP